MAQKNLNTQGKVITGMLKEEQSLLQNTKRFISKLPALYEGEPSSRNDHLLEMKK